jgi:hypothetical protein
VELSSTVFLFANLAHIPSEAWRGRFLAESAKFCCYYTGNDLTQLVWSAVRLGCKPDAAWLQAYADQVGAEVQMHLSQAGRAAEVTGQCCLNRSSGSCAYRRACAARVIACDRVAAG